MAVLSPPNPSAAFPLVTKKRIHPLLRFKYFLFSLKVVISKMRNAPKKSIPLAPSYISIHSIDQVIQPGIMSLLKRFMHFLPHEHNN